MATLEFKNIKKSYDGKIFVINGVDLTIEDKEFIVFVGPSGCGKSTMLRMVAGLTEITSGDMLIDEIIVNDHSPQKRGTAMVFQSYALYPHMTIYDNIAFSLKLKKVDSETIKKRVEAISKTLDLDDLLKRKPASLSGGQRQRVAIGRAIIREPKVLLFDEPLSNLDAKLRGRMRFEISKLREKLDSTFIYVTHDQVEAMTLADRIVVFNGGFIQQVGKPLDLYNKPSNLFVASFIGSPTINTFKGKIEDNIFKNDLFSLSISKSREPQDAILAIRPEDISIIDNKNYDISGKVQLVETLGSETILWIESKNYDFKVKIDGERVVKVGDILNFKFNIEKLHIFNLKTEERV